VMKVALTVRAALIVPAQGGGSPTKRAIRRKARPMAVLVFPD
jgi:hypothetical protein